MNFPLLLSVPNSSSCVLFSTFVHFAGTSFYCLQDWRCVKYTKPVPRKINCSVFTCVPLYSGVQLLKDRHVQVWIVAKGWKYNQAGRFPTSWPRSYSVFVIVKIEKLSSFWRCHIRFCYDQDKIQNFKFPMCSACGQILNISSCYNNISSFLTSVHDDGWVEMFATLVFTWMISYQLLFLVDVWFYCGSLWSS